MNKIKRVIVLVLACLMAVPFFAACGGGTKVSKDPKTINVRFFKGGYGTSWIYELAKKFETAYAAEGYKVNIVNPSSDMRGSVALTDLAKGYESEQIDLYVTGDIFPDKVCEGTGEYGQLVEDITESVYNQKAIGYDGKEEEKTVSEKISDEEEAAGKGSDGKMYGLPYYSISAGFVVNTRKLATYGITELPRTTDELFDCFDKIYLGTNGVQNSLKSRTYPITYVPGTTNGYTTSWTAVLLGQYDMTSLNEFFSLERDGQPMRDNGYEVYNSQAVLEMLTVFYRAFDIEVASAGTATQSLDQAQAQVMRAGGAVFMCNGDWFLNEVALNYKNNLNDIDFINFPVVSALGTKVFGAGTSYNITDAAKCDKILSYICKLVDEWKTIDEIVADVNANADLGITLTAEDAQTIATARGLYQGRGVEHQAYITKGSTKKDIASLFLRMMASDDCAETLGKFANGSSPFSDKINTFTEYKFVESASKVTGNPYATMVLGSPEGFKKTLTIGRQFTTVPHIPSAIATGPAISIYEDGARKSGYTGDLRNADTIKLYRDAAVAMQKHEYDTVKANWSNYVNS